MCTVHDDIEDYESLLFRMADRKNQHKADREQDDGISIDLYLDLYQLKTLLSFY